MNALARAHRAAAACGALALLATAACAQGQPPPGAPLLLNPFHDPFVQLTRGVPDCPVPRGPAYSAEEARREAHWRAERGTSCYREGRCRLPNAYLYDADIIERVQRAVRAHGGFEDTSVWAEGQRRWVTLTGCVRSAAQAAALEALVRRLDDVEAVIPQLRVAPD